MTVYEAACSYEVSCIPPDNHHRWDWVIHVEHAPGLIRGRWAIRWKGRCLDVDGGWDLEPTSSSRTEEWLSRNRFDKTTALELAHAAAPGLTVNGMTVPEMLARPVWRPSS